MPFALVLVLLAVLAALAAGCASAPSPASPEPAPVEAESLTGEPLTRPALDPAFARRQQKLLKRAERRLAADPLDVDERIWVGRRLAYLGRYREAVETYSRGLELHPEEPRLYRHRGHRYITLRRLTAAEEDLERAAELVEGLPDRVEPDGLPNEAGVPVSTLQGNIWYHLGLARYLRGDFAGAETAWRESLELAGNDDSRVAAVAWLYSALRRQDRESDAYDLIAGVEPELELLENHDYHRLILFYQGRRKGRELLDEARSRSPLAFATVGYGIGNWAGYSGRTEWAEEIFDEILASDAWAAFGYIAAEADVARREGGPTAR